MVISFKPYTEKIQKKKIGICSISGRIKNRTRIRIHHPGSGSTDPDPWIRIHHPGSGSADPDPDPHQNDTDPKHCNMELKTKRYRPISFLAWSDLGSATGGGGVAFGGGGGAQFENPPNPPGPANLEDGAGLN